MPQISDQTQKLILKYQEWKKSLQLKEGALTIHVDEVASKVAAFYEKVRAIVDWKEEHLMRRAAIIRKLKRKFFEKELVSINTANELGESLVLELIRGGHFPNDRIEEKKIRDAQRIITKYVSILKRQKVEARLYNWILEIAACEIEEAISPPLKEKALIDYMSESMKERIKITGRISLQMDEDEKNTQIYIAVQRALFKMDAPAIGYNLLKYRHPNWSQFSQEETANATSDIKEIWRKTEKGLNHPLGDKFYKICERYDAPYLILGDIISENPTDAGEKISKLETLESLIQKAYKKRAATIKTRINRAAVYATLSIFITKIALALALEVPFEKYVIGAYNPLALAINIIFPPALMFFLVSTVRPPGRENYSQTIREVIKIVFKTEKKDVYEIRPSRRQGFFFASIVAFFYFLSFLLTLGVITYILYRLNFSILSYLIFIMFISLIAFAGTKIRQRAEELRVIEAKENFFDIILDIFAVPLIQLGNWLANRWQKFNVISAVFSALVDMPFLVFVEFIEHWRYFLRERKEKIH